MAVGSLPRPQWVIDVLKNREEGRMEAWQARKLLDSAVPFAVALQEQAGIDYVSDGEWRRRYFSTVFSDAVAGFARVPIHGRPDFLPVAVDKIRQERPLVSEEAAFLRRLTRHRILVTVPSPSVVARHLWHPDFSRKAYPACEDLMEDSIPIIAREIEELVAIGVDAIQLDDPWNSIHRAYEENRDMAAVRREIDNSVRCLNAVSGAEGAFLSVHLCETEGFYRNGRASGGLYDAFVDAVNRLKVDRVTLEFATPKSEQFEVLSDISGNKLIGLGVVSRLPDRVESPGEIIRLVRKAVEWVPAERVTLNSDCGFAPSARAGVSERLDTVFEKLRALAAAAAQLRGGEPL